MPSKKTKGAKGKSGEDKPAEALPYARPVTENCVIMDGLSGPILAASAVNDSGTNIEAMIRTATDEGFYPHLTLFLQFPVGTNNEESGSGVRFHCSQSQTYNPSPNFRIGIVFHRQKWTQTFEDASAELLSRFPALQGGPATIITFSCDVDDNDRVSIEGLGMTYINDSEPELEKFVNETGSIHGVTLSDFIRRKTFHVLMIRKGTVAHIRKKYSFENLPQPFDYPYGDAHNFDPERCAELLAKFPRTRAFNSVHSFKDANFMLTVTTQSLLQDNLFLWQQAQLVAAVKLRAYFVHNPDRESTYFVILPFPKEFMDQFRPAWKRLLDEKVSLLVWENEDDEKPSGSWRCSFKTYASGIQTLEPHPRGQSEAVLSVSIPPPHEPGSRCNVPGPAVEGEGVTGLTEAVASTTIIGNPPSLRRLPKVSFLPGKHQRYEEALKSGAGYGKTTEMAKTTLAMEYSLGPVFCTAPANVAVTNFAVRIDKITRQVCLRYNDNLPESTPRARHRMVLRGYRRDHELAAFKALLEDPRLGDMAAPRFQDRAVPWCLELSVAFWLLVLLRSPAVRDLHKDDKEALHQLQRDIDTRQDWASLRAVLSTAMDQLVVMADILATTPSLCVSVKEVYNRWWLQAQAVAIDEAANMDRGDLATAWGNKMLPLLCGGDTEQLPPTVLTDDNCLDASGNVYNQFSNDGHVSAQGFLMASGHLVYRMRLQLRMANGLFDIVGKVIYPSIPVRYAPSCNIDLPEFESGHRLESFFRERFPELVAPAEGKFAPIFVHCPDTVVKIDYVHGGKQSRDQVHAALNMVSELVRKKSIDASKVVILSPYKSNVELLNKWTQKHYPELATMSPASTIDGYQGRESDIVFVVMGTKARDPGPGFTKKRNRLNVLLTRQRCGLVIIGDINVVGKMNPKDFGTMPQLDLPALSDFTMAKAPKYLVKGTARAEGSAVEILKSIAPEQYRVWLLLWQSGRVVTMSGKKAANDTSHGVKREHSASPCGFFGEGDEDVDMESGGVKSSRMQKKIVRLVRNALQNTSPVTEKRKIMIIGLRQVAGSSSELIGTLTVGAYVVERCVKIVSDDGHTPSSPSFFVRHEDGGCQQPGPPPIPARSTYQRQGSCALYRPGFRKKYQAMQP
ncbi:P-loop containing nucleoside triphosphate hydrolase protein [Colletotrichum acutatum]|uniref:P-loop containing nucleoside triphosphate hydrolase protein n=1 Tax=Glomerella acutata TaxID=27357 RepID=A0AAD8UB56_GLOAC|nr:P-loop containing nucleoside triphosphate hydrolase protein [Colletotrichum acutatum]KAK1716866.1 P-loop containing nucleoside triphosphate hydrolase protein [Colletotrichum acutatum]